MRSPATSDAPGVTLPSARETASRRPARQFALLVFLGAFVMQAAWILAVPPFRGSDEFDHAYRADSVADGVLLPGAPSADGRGDLVPVSRALVAAAQPICVTYRYVGPDNCFPVAETADGKVLIATAGARYNPVFYAIVGWAAKPFDGTSELYALRIAASMLSSVLFALAAWVVAAAFTTWWPRLGLILAMTPVVAYSNAIPASNGSEIVSGLGLWCCCLGIRANLDRARVVNQLIAAGIPFGVLLATLRSTGPLYVALILATSGFALGASGLGRLWRRHRRPLSVAAVFIAVAGGFNLWWMRQWPITDVLVPGHYPHPMEYAVDQVPLWCFQSIAAFPMRNQPAPPLVYVAYGLLLIGFCTAGIVVAGTRLRVMASSAICTSVAVPVLFTADTYGKYGSIWQGRYGLPISVGALMLCAVALEESALAWRKIHLLVIGGWGLIASAHLVSVLNVLIDEKAHSPLARDPRWIGHSEWMVSALVLLACMTWFWAVYCGRKSLGEDRPRSIVGAMDTRSRPQAVRALH